MVTHTCLPQIITKFLNIVDERDAIEIETQVAYDICIYVHYATSDLSSALREYFPKFDPIAMGILEVIGKNPNPDTGDAIEPHPSPIADLLSLTLFTGKAPSLPLEHIVVEEIHDEDEA